MLLATIKAPLGDVLTFVRVVECGSFSAAAKQLAVPKSSVSRRVSNLERQLAVRLLQRTTRSLRLTDAGEAYFERCRHALGEIAAAERALEFLSEEPRGVLKFTAPVSLGVNYLWEVVGEYSRRHPHVRVIADLTNRYVDLVAEGYDLAIRGGALDDSSLVVRKITTDEFVLVASPGYLSSRGTPTSLGELGMHDCLVFRGQGARTTWKLRGPDGLESVDVEGRIASSDLNFVRAAVLDGFGIGLLPRLDTRAHLESGALERVLPRYRTDNAMLSIVYPSAAYLAPKTRAFVELASEVLRRRIGVDSE